MSDPATPPRLSRSQFVVVLFLVLMAAAGLRSIYPLADPPSHASVGVVWHDEGAWVHNARNRALFGAWIQDDWNPLFITPVMTGLEYVSFWVFGVGLWQARLVSDILGVLSVLAIAAGVARIATPAAGLIAGLLLATNYVYVMYDRAAVMEATMVAFLVIAWWGYVRASDAPAWGVLAAIAAFLAYFSKATGVFFVVSLALDALITLTRRQRAYARGAIWTLGSLAVVGLAALLLFIVPYWDQYHFYNWETSVTRRPSYSLTALKDRITWFPIIHDFFSRMWIVTLLGIGALAAIAARFRVLRPGERVLALWIGFGTLELLARDVGNERYFVYLIPPLVVLAALVLGRDRRLLAIDDTRERLSPGRLAWLTPFMLFILYVAVGSIVRLAFRFQIRPGVRVSATIASLVALAILVTWPRVPRALSRHSWGFGASLVVVALIVAADLAQFGRWVAVRSYKNYAAMRAIADWLPPGTLVHGKLANGLALESRIRPIFIGRNFGNYRDRFSRDDVPYILTYTSPPGLEGQVILEVLAAYPKRRILRTFELSETSSGHDEAALIEKWPGAGQGRKRE
ncbi:MAG: glycosyltransferase family 39 protein [Acidobacteria bacterium]|nr:glycosyltransferase family 39 protein [Acidobacteriota bacterium]